MKSEYITSQQKKKIKFAIGIAIIALLLAITAYDTASSVSGNFTNGSQSNGSILINESQVINLPSDLNSKVNKSELNQTVNPYNVDAINITRLNQTVDVNKSVNPYSVNYSNISSILTTYTNISDRAALRSNNVVYYNQNNKSMFVSVKLLWTTSLTTSELYVGSTSSPTKVISSIGDIGGGYVVISFVVPPNYYYKVNIITFASIKYWLEES